MKSFRYFSMTPRERERLEFHRKIFKFLKHNQVDGIYAEFGIYRGANIVSAYKVAREQDGLNISFLAFDSFEGLPEDDGVFKKGQFESSLSIFKNILDKEKINDIAIYPGWFKDTLHNLPPKIAIAWIDCDIYSSTKEVLEQITSKIGKNTILILDDYYHGEGQRMALEEWLQKNPQIKLLNYLPYKWSGVSFIVL